MMVTENTGGISGAQMGRLREALGGNVVRQETVQRPRQVQSPQVENDRATLADQIQVTLRATNTRFERVQERIVSNEIMRAALGNIQNEIGQLRGVIQRLGNEPMDLDLVSQTINTITRLSENARFNNIPLLSDFNAEALGLTRILPDTPREDIGRTLSQANATIERRLDEVRQENAVERRELESLEIGMENVMAALNAERQMNSEDVQENLEIVRREIRRGGGEVNLTPDRVLELI